MAILGLNQLISKYHYFPVQELNFLLLGDLIHRLVELDISLVALLCKTTGFVMIPAVNDKTMDLSFQQISTSTSKITNLVNVGFTLSDIVVKRAIALGKPHVFDILHDLVPDEDKLNKLARDTMYEMFGPYLDRESSLNVPWSNNASTRIVGHFKIPIDTIESALLTHPGEKSTFEAVHASFPVTRPYLKSKPYSIWGWYTTFTHP